MSLLVSIGIPTYNRPECLEKLLEGLQQQTYKKIEIIISDNASPNNKVKEVIEVAKKKDERIQTIYQQVNIGMENNFNAVFNAAKGDYFMWMSDDDWFDNDYIEKCLTFLNENSDYSLCSGIAKYYSNNKFIFEEKMFSLEDESINHRIVDFYKQVDKNGNFYGLFRKEYLAINPVQEYLGFDWNLLATLAIGGKLKSINSTYYHRSADGVSGGRKQLRLKYGITGWKRPFFEIILAKEVTVNLFKGLKPKLLEGINVPIIRVRIFSIILKKLFIKFLNKLIR